MFTETQLDLIRRLIEEYTEVILELGDPDEAYKYEAISHFQQNWDTNADDFYTMFTNSFKKRSNLLYQNSWGFINQAAKYYPEDVREMFKELYDQDDQLGHRVKNFQKRAQLLLPKLKQLLGKSNFNTQQDERTISFYLACKYPDQCILYKYGNVYQELCNYLKINTTKTGERYEHFQILSQQIADSGLLNNKSFQQAYRQVYPKPVWDDTFIMIQNIIYVGFTIMENEVNIISLLKNFSYDDLNNYYSFLDTIIEKYKLSPNDPRLVFNFRSYSKTNKHIVLTVGQRYTLIVRSKDANDERFRAISTNIFSNSYETFERPSNAYLNNTNQFSDIINNQANILKAIGKELERSDYSGYYKFNNSIIEKMAFDKEYRQELLEQVFSKQDQSETTTITLETKSSEQDILHPKNIILFGAPGTGKTYKLNKEYFKKFTVKESSITKEQFITSLISDLSWWQILSIVLLDLKEAKVNQIVNHELIRIKSSLSNSKNISNTIWGRLQDHTVLECNNVNVSRKSDILLFYKSEQSVWSLVKDKVEDIYPDAHHLLNQYKHFTPSAHKEIKNYEFITFHQSFAYEDFIEGIKPVIDSESDLLSYTIEDGVFKKLCKRAAQDPNNNYAIFIDEINRGNVAQIFGELITLIEETKRKGTNEELQTTLPYSKEKFSVPSNIYIIGTMNTADRSVEALDTALRRRFSFIEVKPEPKLLKNPQLVPYQEVDLEQMLISINYRIEVLIDKDHQIGHSYFIGIKTLDELKIAFKDKVIPLLEEFFFGDFGKIGLVLGGEFIYTNENNIKFPSNFDYHDNFYEEKRIYSFTKPQDWDEGTFISIYEEE